VVSLTRLIYGNTNMVAFDTSGNVRWAVPNDTPMIATADCGVIGQAGNTYDQSGNATGQIPLYTQSWTYSMYQDGQLTQAAAMPTLLATSWAFQMQKTAVKPLPDSVKANIDVVSGLGTFLAQREIDYYPFQGNTYWGCDAPGYNPNANETFCSFGAKDFEDFITYGFVRRQQIFMQLPNVRNYRVQIYPCTAQNTYGKPVWENQLSAPTQAAILVNGDGGSTTQRTCTQ
jgi:hypothetical protein